MKQLSFLLSVRLTNPFIFMALLSILCHSPVSASLYDVVMDDIDWQLHEKKHFECRLYQKVPLFGGVSIIAEAGHQQSIELETSLYPTRPESVQVWIMPQPWGHYSKGSFERASEIYRPGRHGQRLLITDYFLSDNFQVKGLQVALKMPVRQLLDRLDSRSYLSVYTVEKMSQNSSPASNTIEVRIPTVGMLPAMKKMSECIARLLPRNFRQLHQYNLHYALGQFLLNNHQRQWLLDTVRYVAVDKNIREITIDGNTDNTPFSDSYETIDRLQNLELSKKRADAVRNQLEQYLKEAKIGRPVNVTARHHGERYPVASNATAAGRYKNRRVEVTLLHDANKSPMEESEDPH
ncbi:OmpA family protein [Endozoicomonas acroporae]|uniref:MotY family protein n=1 Tax=Endozoicomonas acroporae TaxID=1701104 RepID=UPI000C75B8C0|nr:OmpA family protein [Endozoicomonas acroporae]